MSRSLRALLFAASVLAPAAVAAAADTCPPGRWLVPGDAVAAAAAPWTDLAGRPVVLLGERHDSAEHHRWQLYTVAALHAHNPNMVLAFEMFPRSAQPALDAWVAGGLTVAEFLERTDWAAVWGYPADLYLPLFHFARQHRVPMIAMNVDRGLVGRVGRAGWEAVPAAERQGLSDPAPPSEDYRRSLAGVYAFKARHGDDQPEAGDPGWTEPPGDVDAVLDDPGFARFVEAQLVWDRAMAEAAAAAHRGAAAPLVIGIVGRGHAEFGWGIPHQLGDLGIPDAAVLLPVDGPTECERLERGVADAVFVIEPLPEPEAARPRLGVMVEAGEGGGARVVRVLDDSVAAAAGLETGDVIRRAAGVALDDHRDLIAVVGRQAPGTWLPLDVDRSGDRRELVARFPTHFDAAD